MKFTDILKSANVNLFRNKMRSFLTILAIFVGSFAIISVNAIHTGVNDFIDQQVESIGGDNYIEIAPTAAYDQLASMMGTGEITKYNANKSSSDATIISEEDLSKIRKIDGVISMNPYYQASVDYITTSHTDKKYNAVISLMPGGGVKADLSAGNQINSNSSDYEILISEDYAKKLGFDTPSDAVNQTATFGVKQSIKCYTVANPDDCIATLDAKIVGVQAPSILSIGGIRVNQAANDAIYNLASEGIAPDIKNRTPMATGEIDSTKLNEIRADLKKLGFTAITIDDEVGMIRTFFNVILIVFTIFGAIALIAAAIGIINTLLMSVQERTREIGLEKALGLSKGKIFLSFSIEAIMLGFWGSALGTAVAMILGFIANNIFHQSGGFLEKFPTFNLVKFTPESVAALILIVMFIAFIAGTMPARKAAKKDPIEALRYE
ncbi:ABC transporter permease [Candidatus Saccharibacteria bacterium]|nr:ABC transporter permease [Candidatus Saccharibacteria bacterium]